jgi:phosphatidylserine/phosphatidylglycerophosphate/cardiolipin synthase-like enzyme
LPSRIAQAVVGLDPVAAIASEHDKLLLVDRRTSIVGGRNVGAEYFADPRTSPGAFRDVDLLVEGGGACRALERAFDAEWVAEAAGPVAPETVNLDSQADVLLGAFRAMDAWLRGRPDHVAGDPACEPWLAILRDEHPGLHGALSDPRPDEVRAPVRLLNSAPRRTRGDDPVTEGLRRLLGAAEREVLVISPYLVLSEAAVQVLERAAARGVEITILTNSPTSSDNAVSQAFFMEQWPELLARVPTLRLFVRGDGHNLHAKAAVVDDRVAVVSTYNLDPVSMYVDGEVAVVAWSELLAARLAAPARTWIATGGPETLEYRIARDPSGAVRRDADGDPIVVFGPEDHTDPERWTGLAAWWTLLRTLEDWVGFDPIF